MAVILMNNHNDIIVDPISLRRTGAVITDAVFSVTLFDPDGNPVSGATALTTAYESDTKANTVLLPGSVTLTEGSGYTIDANGTGAYANAINIEEAPAVVVKRRG